MWKGKFDDNLNELYNKYEEKFGCDPDTYEEIAYYAMTYDEFVGYIKKCLVKGLEIPDVVD